MHAIQRYLRAAEDLRCCSWCFEQIFEDRESFLLQRKCAMSASVEIILFWAWLIIFNYFEFTHQQSIEECTRENSELVNQVARIVWASLISSLEVSRYDWLPHRFSLTFQPPLFSVENWKEKQYSTLVWTCNVFLNFFAFGYSCFMIVLWLEILQFGNLWCNCT